MPLPVLPDVPAALRFLSRLPVRLPSEPATDGPPDLDRLGPALPLAGALLGLIGALVLVIAHRLGLGDFLAATLAVATLVAISGALHEDGMSDVADALGGADVARRLEIMKDSRVGAFGVCALILAFALRIGALAGLLAFGPLAAAAGLMAAAGASRLAGLWMLAALPFARADGLARSAGVPGGASRCGALGIGFVIAALLVIPTVGLPALVGGVLAGIAAFRLVVRLARAQFGGQTGDVAGAATLLVEIAFLIGLLIFAR
ncbi:adenosylcobinamide-GDP ribazoletransferase [Ancylobacter dichloromethanicus]|uniref:Adenosylcobinamide-GDP ribazoletransferase n=1 Tax=Ancylobacter dichloromethanicus TaxID=518825 RepID=A0A9W6MXR8_9HYPH|nr:adenosylcobinamide-GDP ribazoletransferase [Ancylobacter dichloromethanicus]MBS7552996.1 adenosylcobinamide-GDP ribazoletransferase [Ancylobacter dichloromethanicus]GLK70316.1 adenosylcobinamide-GDP ribazoletransferase [Ancylobacter dichloromethanicus]